MMLTRPTPPLGIFTFGGTGILTGLRDGRVVIIEVWDNSPAKEAGLQPGDVIAAVNGLSTQGRTLDGVGQMIRGPEGTSVQLAIERSGQTLTVTITRRRVVAPWYYAMGWLVRPTVNGMTWWLGGDLPGTSALLVRAAEGWAWAALFNSQPRDAVAFDTELDTVLWQAARDVSEWPGHDLFSQYP